MYRYIHNWSLQALSQDYDLVSHITHVMCVNLIHERRDLQFTAMTDLRETFHGKSICSESFFHKSAERQSSKNNFVICSLVGDV